MYECVYLQACVFQFSKLAYARNSTIKLLASVQFLVNFTYFLKVPEFLYKAEVYEFTEKLQISFQLVFLQRLQLYENF